MPVMESSVRTWLLLSLAAALGAGCNGVVSPSTMGRGGASGVGSVSGGGGASGSGNATGAGGAEAAYLPARVRRITNAEYDASVQALLGTTMAPSVQFSFPPDARQGPTSSPAGPAFTLNDAQRVDPVLADKLDTAALAVVAEARANGKLAALAPCADRKSTRLNSSHSQ